MEDIFVGGYFDSNSIDLGNGKKLETSSMYSYKSDGMIIKYDSKGNAEWGKKIGGSAKNEINLAIETTDGGYIAVGYFSIGRENFGNGIVLTNHNSNGVPDGMIIKYDNEGNVEWAKAVGGTESDSISSVVETEDGGYIVGGYFYSSSIDLGNGIVLTNQGSNDGMLIKYDSEGNVEWAKAIGGTSNDYIDAVSETSDGGYICRRIFLF